MNDLRKAACIARAAIKSALDESFKLIRNGQMVYTQGALHDALVELNTALSQPDPVQFKCTVVDDDHPNGVPLSQWGRQPDQEPVAHLWECIGRWTAMIVHDGEDANLATPDWLVDAVKAATKPVDTVNTSQERVDETAKRGHEPVAWWVTLPGGEIDWSDEPIKYKEDRPLETLRDGCDYAPLYTAPPKREWKGLTSDDKHFLLANAWNKEQAFDGFMEAIDKFLEEKNS